MASFLATFHLPEETVADLVERLDQLSGERDETERDRRDLRARLERIRELYKWGDLTRDGYLAERDELEQRLAGLQGRADRAAVLQRVAAFLRDLPAAWDIATPEERNALARIVFQSVEIADDLMVAVVPQPEFAPFFNLVDPAQSLEEDEEKRPREAAPNRQDSTLAGGSDGERSRTKPLPLGFLRVRESLPVVRSGRGGRSSSRGQRGQKLTPEELFELRRDVRTGASLRSLAARHNVSHEFVRQIRQGEATGTDRLHRTREGLHDHAT